QRDAFSDATGRSPGHVDGHQHVHQLPQIRDIVVDAEATTPAAQRFAIRSTGRVIGPGHAFKRMVIEGTGGRGLLRMLRERRIRHNAALLGVYDFQDPDYRRLVRGWLASAPADGGLVFCHPLATSPTTASVDAITAARRREADYLGSDAFAEDLATAGFKVAAAWQSSSAG
ncbi:MAG TPA: ChbG/HpnK family deacetylase, partial [Caldimonas sp.]|nr:ChbG/HpnK family deacetylase [Caldimonas sp.]